MGTWTLSARYTGCESFLGAIDGLELAPSHGGSYLYMWRTTNPHHFYRYNAFAETITEVAIPQYTMYGQTYRPDRLIYHNGYLYGIKCVHWNRPWPTPDVFLLQCFRIDPTTGALTLVLDTWQPIGCERIWAFHTDCNTEESRIHTAKICSWGGMMYIAIGQVFTPYDFDPIPPWCAWQDNDTNNHCTGILQSIDGAWWDAGFKVEAGKDARGVAVLEVTQCCVGHEFQLCAGWAQAGIRPDRILFIDPGGWHYHQEAVGIVTYPETGFSSKFWIETAPDDLSYATTNFLPAGWTFYNDYDQDPDPPQSPHAVAIGGFGGGGASGPIILDAAAMGNLKIYYGGTLDAQIACGMEQAWAGAVTFRDDYACVQYSAAGVEYLDVYTRDEHSHMIATPLGMDIDQGDTSLYIMATTISGLTPFLIEVDTSVMGSGIFRYSTGCSGYIYPHAGFGQCYLWGYCNPYLKALLYTSQVLGGMDPLGAAKGILPGLPIVSYIGGLHTSPLFNDDDIHFAVVTTSGWLGSSVDTGDSWTRELDLPWPVDVVYRNFVSDSIGSGSATWIGADGGYACPIKMTPNLVAWGNRCTNLPAVTVTDIDSFD